MGTVLAHNNKILMSNNKAFEYISESQSSKSYTVSASGNQTISPDTGYDAMDVVALSVPAGSAGTPSATKGTVSNHAVSVTPSVTNSTGWITGGTKSGTAVSVNASELVSGTKEITSNGTNIDVTNYASVDVNVSAGGNIQTSKSYTVSASGNQTISPDSGYDAMNNVSLTVPQGSLGSANWEVTKDSHYHNTKITFPNATPGYLSVFPTNINTLILEDKNAVPGTTTQTITPTNEYRYLNSVTVSGDANLVAGNIKKDVTIFNTTGTYEGSSSSVTLKMGVVRPDAELLQTWSDDYLLHTDKGITIPSYSTTATTLLTGGTALTPTVTLSNANYRYYLLQRFLTIPQYSITTLAKGRQEYTAMSMCYEIVAFPAFTFSALVNTTKYTSRNTAMIPAGNSFIRNVYWSSGTALSIYTANTYGCAQTIQTAPSISSGTAASPTLTVYTPNATIRGSTTYLVNTFYNAITDIRCQYVIELYRIPVNTTSTYGMDGWGHYTQMLHNITCAQSSTHKLT